MRPPRPKRTRRRWPRASRPKRRGARALHSRRSSNRRSASRSPKISSAKSPPRSSKRPRRKTGRFPARCRTGSSACASRATFACAARATPSPKTTSPNSYVDFLTVNDEGGIGRAGPDALINTTEDRQRLRARLRFGVETELGYGWSTAFRLATGNLRDPVSTNQTLGNTGWPLHGRHRPGVSAAHRCLAQQPSPAHADRRPHLQSVRLHRPGVRQRPDVRGHHAPTIAWRCSATSCSTDSCS